jgi:hypothetical protein
MTRLVVLHRWFRVYAGCTFWTLGSFRLRNRLAPRVCSGGSDTYIPTILPAGFALFGGICRPILQTSVWHYACFARLQPSGMTFYHYRAA